MKLNISVTCERIDVSVTTPDLEDRADFLLGAVQSESSKGSDQAHFFLNLKYFEITDHIYGIY